MQGLYNSLFLFGFRGFSIEITVCSGKNVKTGHMISPFFLPCSNPKAISSQDCPKSGKTKPSRPFGKGLGHSYKEVEKEIIEVLEKFLAFLAHFSSIELIVENTGCSGKVHLYGNG